MAERVSQLVLEILRSAAVAGSNVPLRTSQLNVEVLRRTTTPTINTERVSQVVLEVLRSVQDLITVTLSGTSTFTAAIQYDISTTNITGTSTLTPNLAPVGMQLALAGNSTLAIQAPAATMSVIFTGTSQLTILLPDSLSTYLTGTSQLVIGDPGVPGECDCWYKIIPPQAVYDYVRECMHELYLAITALQTDLPDITDSTGGTPGTIPAFSPTYSQAEIQQGLATLLARLNEITALHREPYIPPADPSVFITYAAP